jgi:hypothetical protein
MLLLLALAASAQTWELQMVESGNTTYPHRWPQIVPENNTDDLISLLDDRPETYTQGTGWTPIPFGNCTVELSATACASYANRGNSTVLYRACGTTTTRPT